MLTSAWVLAGLVVLITGASLWKFQVWWVRMFDLPRAQTIVLGTVAIILFMCSWPPGTAEWIALVAVVIAMLHQARKVVPYTFLAPVMARKATPRSPDERISLVVANVLAPNR
ncbi:MAG: hypothetical protein KDB84_03300, partial [Flavobacteriales bacterium]|nr:hypothetical protein [Flavobacteriales bacterium]